LVSLAFGFVLLGIALLSPAYGLLNPVYGLLSSAFGLGIEKKKKDF
jgi:hypothetical protein